MMSSVVTELAAEYIKVFAFFSHTYNVIWISFILRVFLTTVNKAELSLGLSMCPSLCFLLTAVSLFVHFLEVDSAWLTASVFSTLSAIVSVFFLIKLMGKRTDFVSEE